MSISTVCHRRCLLAVGILMEKTFYQINRRLKMNFVPCFLNWHKHIATDSSSPCALSVFLIRPLNSVHFCYLFTRMWYDHNVLHTYCLLEKPDKGRNLILLIFIDHLRTKYIQQQLWVTDDIKQSHSVWEEIFDEWTNGETMVTAFPYWTLGYRSIIRKRPSPSKEFFTNMSYIIGLLLWMY